jgi:muconolactone delta-isomerase
MKIGLERTLAPDLAAQLEAQEAIEIGELSARGDCQVMTLIEGEKLAGYAVFGLDRGDMLTVYMARATAGYIAKAAMMGLFGAAKIAKVPVRVHTQKVAAMARMMGAPSFLPAIDGDGLPMGVFYGQ